MAPSSSLPIGVFDSGLGGLTVVKELIRRLPQENLIYVGDTARVPYGTKSPSTIKRYALQIASFLLKKRVKAVVVACNSASSVALRALRHFPVPVIGVIEPGATAAVQKTRKHRVGVIGTQATVNSQAYKKAIKKISRKTQVWQEACPLFVPLVEEGRLHDAIATQVASVYLRPLRRKNVDTLVLGCTHYPLLKKTLKKVVGSKTALIDSAEETTKQIYRTLKKKNHFNPSRKKGKVQFFTTDNPEFFTRLGHRFLGRAIRPAKFLSLERL